MNTRQTYNPFPHSPPPPPAPDDYDSTTTTIIFCPDSNSTMCVTISVTQDGVVENDMEIFQVNLTSSDPAVVLTRASIPVIIFESDCKSCRYLSELSRLYISLLKSGVSN